MSINGIALGYQNRYEPARTQRGRSGRIPQLQADSGAPAEQRAAKSASAMDVYNRMNHIKGVVVKEIKYENILSQSRADGETFENERYRIELSNEIEGMPAYRIYDKERDVYFTFLPAETSFLKDGNTGKKYLVEALRGGGGLNNAFLVDDALYDGLKQFMKVDSIASGELNDKYVINKDPYIGIEIMHIKGQEGRVSVVLPFGEEEERKLQELADLYKETYPNLVTEATARCYALGELCRVNFRTANGILTIAIGGMIYNDDKDPSKHWGISYSGDDHSIYGKLISAMSEGIIKPGNMENADAWEKVFMEEEIDYERTGPEDEGSEEQEDATKTEVLVKPDGSRVLVITRNIGGMETTMTLQLSQPTKLPNDSAGESTENLYSARMSMTPT